MAEIVHLSQNDIFETFVHVTLPKREDFLRIRETLERIGILSRNVNPGLLPTLYQSCHILHKQGRYAIVHFKEMFLLDGKTASMSEDDVKRRNLIASLLESWGMVKLVRPIPRSEIGHKGLIEIIPYAKRNEYNFCSKYTIGKPLKVAA